MEEDNAFSISTEGGKKTSKIKGCKRLLDSRVSKSVPLDEEEKEKEAAAGGGGGGGHIFETLLFAGLGLW